MGQDEQGTLGPGSLGSALDDAEIPKGLASLPTELLRRIAPLCDGTSLIALGRASTRLHHVCNDLLVLRECVAQQLLYHASGDETVAAARLDAIKLRAQNDPRIWARYSVALGELASLAHKPDEQFRFQPDSGDCLAEDKERIQKLSTRIMSFIPQLLAIGCDHLPRRRQTCSFLASTIFTDKDLLDKSAKMDESTLTKLAFCFAAESMDRPPPCSLDMLRPNAAADPESTSTSFSRDLSPVSLVFFDLIRREPFLSANHAARYIIIGLVSSALSDHAGVRTPRFDTAYFRLPAYALDLPLPFDGPSSPPDCAAGIAATERTTSSRAPSSSWDDWLRLTVSRLVTRDYLCGGDWRGYRTSDPRMRSFRGMMELSDFTVERSDKKNCRVRARVRQVGGIPSGIQGTIAKEDGRCELIQEFPGGYACRCLGYLTPFGIVGYWQATHVVHDPVGVFWWWREPRSGGGDVPARGEHHVRPPVMPDDD